jgi:hypothetical protein
MHLQRGEVAMAESGNTNYNTNLTLQADGHSVAVGCHARGNPWKTECLRYEGLDRTLSLSDDWQLTLSHKWQLVTGGACYAEFIRVREWSAPSLSAGAKTGVAVGVSAGGLLLVVIGVYCWRRRKTTMAVHRPLEEGQAGPYVSLSANA